MEKKIWLPILCAALLSAMALLLNTMYGNPIFKSKAQKTNDSGGDRLKPILAGNSLPFDFQLHRTVARTQNFGINTHATYGTTKNERS